MPTLILILILVSAWLFWAAGRKQRQAGLPSGKVIYTDTRAWGKVDDPLYDPVYDLTGKPDYLVEENGMIIPVEVKTGRTPQEPYDSHIYQLAAYCLLVERAYGKRPSYGIIHYERKTFAVPYTPALEKSLVELLDEIHNARRKRSLPRSHEQQERCRGCGFRRVCDQRL